MFAWRSGVALIPLLASACSYHLYSPPARAVPLESPRALPVAHNAIAVEGAISDGYFDPTILSGAVRYRRGLAAQLDGSADLTVMHVLDAPDSVNVTPIAGALRAGVKYQGIDAMAVFAGLGGGGSAAGGFMSPDLGVILGYENPYVVPFFSLRVFLSQPLGPRRVFLGREDGEPRFSTPRTTWGGGAALGVRIPLEHRRKLTHSLSFGLAVTELCDKDQCHGYLSLGANFEGVYAPESSP